jgi:DNA excision repair protein ERCC-6-like 2
MNDYFGSQDFAPRPTIPRKSDQPLRGPFLLNEGQFDSRGKKLQVPGSINTYLRDYQRDGIKFFWDRFKNGQGGLLGDDMGLVSFLLYRKKHIQQCHK